MSEAAPWPAGAAVTRGRPLVPQIHRLVRRAIVVGRLAPGAAIREPALATGLGVSRTPIREALLRLQGEGLVDMRPQAGTFVSAVDPARVEEAILVRDALEPRVVRATALRIGARELARLEGLTAEMAAAAAAGDHEGFIAADDGFHGLLVEASGHRHVAAIVATVNAHLDRLRHRDPGPERPRASVREHAAIIAALRARDPDAAAAALAFHLERAWKVIRTLAGRTGRGEGAPALTPGGCRPRGG